MRRGQRNGETTRAPTCWRQIQFLVTVPNTSVRHLRVRDSVEMEELEIDWMVQSICGLMV